MDTHFLSIFRQSDASAARGKYLSRIFGIFSEEIVRMWASDHRCPYEDLGRPTLRRKGKKAGYTLDFTLRHKETGKSYVAELKLMCRPSNAFKSMRLNSGVMRHRGII